MPSDTLDAPDAKRLERTSGVRVYHSPAIGLEYWVFNLAPHVTSRVHKSVVQRPGDPQGAGLGDRPHASSCRRRCSATAHPATRSSRATTRASRSTSRTTPCSATTTTRRTRAASSTPAGWKLGPDGVRSKERRARLVRARLRGGDSSEKRAVTLIRAWARDVGIAIDVRVYDNDKLINLEFNTDGDKLQPDFDTELWSIGGDPTPEFLLSLFTKAQLGVWNDSGFVDQHLRAAVQAGDTRDADARAPARHPAAAAHRHAATCPTSSCTSPTIWAP